MGNVLAQQAISEVFRLKASSEWRGLGEIAESGVELTDDYQCLTQKRILLVSHIKLLMILILAAVMY